MNEYAERDELKRALLEERQPVSPLKSWSWRYHPVAVAMREAFARGIGDDVNNDYLVMTKRAMENMRHANGVTALECFGGPVELARLLDG